MTDPRLLAGKRTVITGASRGIGADLAHAFAAAGATLVLSGRDAVALHAQADLLRAEHDVDITVVAADLAEPAAPEELAAAALAAYGGLDVLINNAGISHPQMAVDVTPALLDDVLNVNLRAPSLLAARVGAAMAAAGSGSIITMASAAGLRALEEHYGYCIAKAGLIMATKVLALELGALRCPGQLTLSDRHADRHGAARLVGSPGQGRSDAGPDPATPFRLPSRSFSHRRLAGVRRIVDDQRRGPAGRRGLPRQLRLVVTLTPGVNQPAPCVSALERLEGGVLCCSRPASQPVNRTAVTARAPRIRSPVRWVVSIMISTSRSRRRTRRRQGPGRQPS